MSNRPHLHRPHLHRPHFRRPHVRGHLDALFGGDLAGARHSLVALFLNSSSSFVAGGVLGAITGTFERHPGLLVLVPAAIGLRGNIFGSLDSRLSTAIHTGTFRFSARRDTVLGQNVSAAVVLTLVLSVIIAAVAKVIAVAFGLDHTIAFTDAAVVSVVGGVIGSVFVLGSSISMAGGAVRYGWDLDNVAAPIMSTLGDALTVPALWLATAFIGVRFLTPTLALLFVAGSMALLAWGWRSPLHDLRRVVRESLPILTLAGAVSAMAGITVEKQLVAFTEYPALLVLLPAFLSSAGALGGILSGRLGSKLHLGLVVPDGVPSKEARRDIASVATLALPVFLFNAVGAHLVGTALGQRSPGVGPMLAVTAVGAVIAVAIVLTVAYYGAIAAFRLGVDPDTYGIPLVTSTVDFAGAFALVLAIVALGVR